MDALAWAVAFILMVCALGGSAVGCVALSERGKNKRTLEQERTKRTGMENAWQLEQSKIALMSPAQATKELGKFSEVSFTLPGERS